MKIAVIGGGAAGITAAHLLQKKHHVTLFEASDAIGGHAHHERILLEGKEVVVDTAFLIFNEHTYRNFGKLIQELGVTKHVIQAEMSSCFSDPEKNFDYTLGNGWAPFFARPQIFARSEMYQIIFDLLRFRHRAVKDIDAKKDLTGITAGEYLASYSATFRENFVWPLTSAIWSLAEGQMKDYPIQTLLDYFDNHQLLRGKSERKWKTFKNSSGVYVNAFQNQFKGSIRLHSRISRLSAGCVELTSGETEMFDHIVLATHADTALELLAKPSELEESLLGPWKYKNNPVTLHHDTSVLHKDSRLWGSWNMRRENDSYQISYYLNRLQALPIETPVILTLGEAQIDEKKLLKHFRYRHPIFEKSSVSTQKNLSALNGDQFSFCGSYFGHGFHEDAVASAVQVARRFGCSF